MSRSLVASVCSTLQPGGTAVAPGNDRKSLLSVAFAINVVGIYVCFLSTSVLHELIYRSRTEDGVTVSPWVVNTFEAGANVLVGFAGVSLWEGWNPATLPQRSLAPTGSSQVIAKYLASASRVAGVPAPVTTLVKAARPLPVMLGQRFIAGTTYTLREYVQYLLIIFASLLVGYAQLHDSSAKAEDKAKNVDNMSTTGLVFMVLSIVCDGYVGGRQKDMQQKVRLCRRAQGMAKSDLLPFEMQFYTNLYMLLAAAFFAVWQQLWTGELRSSLTFLAQVPQAWFWIFLYATCSAIGQIFIFACVTSFDPLILSVVTSLRKLLSVVLTLILFGYRVDAVCVLGLLLAGVGFGMVFSDEVRRQRSKQRGPPRGGAVTTAREMDSVPEESRDLKL